MIVLIFSFWLAGWLDGQSLSDDDDNDDDDDDDDDDDADVSTCLLIFARSPFSTIS